MLTLQSHVIHVMVISFYHNFPLSKTHTAKHTTTSGCLWFSPTIYLNIDIVPSILMLALTACA